MTLQKLLATLWPRLTHKQSDSWVHRIERSSRDSHRLQQRIDHRAWWTLFDATMSDGGTTSPLWKKLLNVLERDELAPDFHYRYFTKPKDDGTKRKLAEPDHQLKAIQHEIRKRYLKKAPVHPSALGFRRKKSTADHAWAHAGAHTIVTADVVDFFPNTKAYRVQQWWEAVFPDYPDAARLYTLLTTKDGGLPQGAPTSPDLSNVVNFEMDATLERRVKVSGGTYTRYCDDLAFSWRGRSAMPSDFEAGIRSALGEYGYHLHDWRVWEDSDEPQITGITLTKRGGVALPDELRATMRQLARSRDPVDQARLQGYRSYEAMVARRK
jgi:RNA-directed DNA polymerase